MQFNINFIIKSKLLYAVAPSLHPKPVGTQDTELAFWQLLGKATGCTCGQVKLSTCLWGKYFPEVSDGAIHWSWRWSSSTCLGFRIYQLCVVSFREYVLLQGSL